MNLSVCEREDYQKSKTMADLPTEVITTILLHITTVKDLNAAVATCKLWNQVGTQRLYQFDAERFLNCTFWAIDEQRIETIRRMIEFDTARFNDDSVRLAVKPGNIDFIEELLKSHRFHEELRQKTMKRHAQPLVETLKAKRLDIAMLLLENGIDVDQIDSFGNHPLAAAVRGQHLTIVEMLLDRGAKLAPRDDYHPRYDALTLAVRTEKTVILQKLLAAQPHQYQLDKALERATEAGNDEMVKILLETGASPS